MRPLAHDLACRMAVGVAAVCAAHATLPAIAAPSAEKPATTMLDLRDHFSACFQPPKEAAGSRVTFYFSLNNRGQVLGPPRATWLGFKGANDEKARRLADFKNDFGKCLPLSMDTSLAATIPGKVYFLQYIVADTGKTQQVLLRPFGSHYYDGGGVQLPNEPEEVIHQQTVPPVYFPSRARPPQPPPRIFRPVFRRFRPFIFNRSPMRPEVRPLPLQRR